MQNFLPIQTVANGDSTVGVATRSGIHTTPQGNGGNNRFLKFRSKIPRWNNNGGNQGQQNNGHVQQMVPMVPQPMHNVPMVQWPVV